MGEIQPRQLFLNIPMSTAKCKRQEEHVPVMDCGLFDQDRFPLCLLSIRIHGGRTLMRASIESEWIAEPHCAPYRFIIRSTKMPSLRCVLSHHASTFISSLPCPQRLTAISAITRSLDPCSIQMPRRRSPKMFSTSLPASQSAETNFARCCNRGTFVISASSIGLISSRCQLPFPEFDAGEG